MEIMNKEPLLGLSHEQVQAQAQAIRESLREPSMETFLELNRMNEAIRIGIEKMEKDEDPAPHIAPIYAAKIVKLARLLTKEK